MNEEAVILFVILMVWAVTAVFYTTGWAKGKIVFAWNSTTSATENEKVHTGGEEWTDAEAKAYVKYKTCGSGCGCESGGCEEEGCENGWNHNGPDGKWCYEHYKPPDNAHRYVTELSNGDLFVHDLSPEPENFDAHFGVPGKVVPKAADEECAVEGCENTNLVADYGCCQTHADEFSPYNS